MKKNLTYFLFVILLLSAGVSNAQSTDSVKAPGKNLLKINLTAIPLNNYSFQYERVIGKKISAGVGVRFMPKGKIPLKSQIENLIGDDDDLLKQIDGFRTGNFAITPEIRFYLSKGVFKGFYAAPFMRYSSYSASVPFEFEVDNPLTGTTTEEMPLDGHLNTITGGLLLGWQFKISKKVFLDWWMLGPQYGSASGNIKGTKSLSSDEQQGLRDELANLEDLPLVKVKSTVNANGATVDFSGPWAGVRAGINIGFRF
jgi:hypothetical protein